MVFEVYQNVGGAHPQTWYKAFNWDVAKKAPVTFDTLFKPGTRPLDVIFPIVQSEVNRQLGVDGADLTRRRPGPGEVPGTSRSPTIR